MEDHETMLQRFRQDREYYDEHREELLEKYPEKWIAILDQRVIEASDDLDELFERLRRDGISMERVLIEHPTREEITLILYS